MIYHANCLDVIASMGDNTLDALVTDPPYGLGFMGRAWDKALPDPRIWRECLRAMKPGAHGVIFGAPRMYHRLACQVEDAGFEVRDVLMWMFGSGFPKSHDPSKAVGITSRDGLARDLPQSEEARRLLGLGTALKPAYEPILLVRKPLRGTVAENVLAYGTGCLNIGACRVGDEPITQHGRSGDGFGFSSAEAPGRAWSGRWPANVVLDEEAGALLDGQSGYAKDGVAVNRNRRERATSPVAYAPKNARGADVGFGGGGGASRFFYCAKASKAEREAGLEHLDTRTVTDGRAVTNDTAYQRGATERRNTHPTVKPIALMRYLVRLIAPEGGTVFDPFTGSGSTGVACALEDVAFVGAELEAEYVKIANARVEHALGLFRGDL